MNATKAFTAENLNIEPFSYQRWREKVLDLFLRGACGVGILPMIFPGFHIFDRPALGVIYIVAYLAMVAVTFIRLPYWVRTGVPLLVTYALGITTLLNAGIGSNAGLVFVVLSVLALVLTGTRGGMAALGLSLLAYVILGWLVQTGQITSPGINLQTQGLTDWLSSGAIVGAIGLLIQIALIFLFREIASAQQYEQQVHEALVQERTDLEARVEVRTAQLQASADVGRAASSILNTDQLLHEVVNLIGDRFKFYYVAAFIVDESGRWAVLREATGEAGQLLKAQGHKMEVGGQSMVGYATGQRKSRIALDVGADAVRFANPLLPYSRSEIALPLLVGDRVIGALDVQSAKSAAFDENYATSLQGMADQIAVAINNAGQYQREQVHAEQTSRLLQATLELTRQTDRAAVEEQLVQLALSLFNADGAQLWSKFEGRLVLKAARSARPATEQSRALSQGLVERVFNTGLTVRTDNASDQADPAADASLQVAIVAPIIWQENVTGVLSITRAQPAQAFNQDDESSIQLLAAQAATTLENIALVEQQRHTLDELNIVNRRLTGEAWQAQTGEQELAYVYHRPGTSKEDQSNRLAEIPIELHGQPIGAISLQDTPDHRAFTADEHAILQAVVQQMGLVLENQRLAEVAQRTAQRDRAVAEAADRIHRPTDLDAVLRVAAEELSRITALSEIGIQLGFTPVEQLGGHDHPLAAATKS